MDKIHFLKFGSTDIEIAVLDSVVSPKLQSAIQKGHYEKEESDVAGRLAKKSSVALDIGAGLGLISTIMMRANSSIAVHCFEADPRLIPLILATQQRNNVKAAGVYHCAVVAQNPSSNQGSLPFEIKQDFWANSLANNKSNHNEIIRVQTMIFSDLVKTYQPSLLVIDIEGEEKHLFSGMDLSSVDRVCVEIHKSKIGPMGIKRVFRELHRQGFFYDPRFSRGTVPVFTRHK
jgi:FkbM family methyltransferase